MKRALFKAIVIMLPLVVLLAVAASLLPRIVVGLRSQVMQYMVDHLDEDVRRAAREQLVQGRGFWDAVPDPDVAGLGRPNTTVMDTGAEARFNNAGLRAALPYVARSDSVFRIVCLGDSYVFGMGGPEEDRFCDQLAAFYREHAVAVDGRPIEAYAVGLPGWTLVQEATYLATRLSSYDPDLIILLSVPNDITDNYGVTGAGGLTKGFSPEHRALGSAVFLTDINTLFGDLGGERSALTWDLSPESRRRWDKAMGRLDRLVRLQQGRGKRILVSVPVVDWNPEAPDAHAALFQSHFDRVGIPAPLAVIGLPLRPATTLPHDVHPSRVGHGLLRDQYVRLLHALGWIPVPESVLPRPSRRAPVWLDPAPDLRPYHEARQRFLTSVDEAIDFTDLRLYQTRAFLGGLFPESMDRTQALRGSPWASVRTAFLLRRPSGRPLQGVEIELEIPSRPELFPFALTLFLDGAEAGSLRLDRPGGTDRYRISGVPVAPPFFDGVVEVVLETGAYFSTIDDPRMKSYRPVRAQVY